MAASLRCLFGRASRKQIRALYSSLVPVTAVCRVPTRSQCTQRLEQAALWQKYYRTKTKVEDSPLPEDRNPKAIFANNELDLDQVEVFGFDYDYTLASYKDTLHDLIYEDGKKVLIDKFKYPEEISQIPYDPTFAIRGLHCDVKKGLLMKIDSFLNIQLGTVYRGLCPVDDDEVISLYRGTHVAIEDLSFYGTGPHMFQLMDLFAVPEITLLASVMEYFIKQNIPYDPECVFYDVRQAVQGLHSSGQLHTAIMNNIEHYLEKTSEVKELLETLVASGKKLFLITNSGISFVDKGMSYLMGPEWLDAFDVVITNARKPKFFTEHTRTHKGNIEKPFRLYCPDRSTLSFDRVTKLKKGSIYFQGNLAQLQKMTNWYGCKVLYFGDHVYSDLADPTLKHGWRTGAIIPELENEIEIQNSKDYKKATRWLNALQGLIEESQMYEDEESEQILNAWCTERSELRQLKKKVFNPRFGSLFRTYHNSTYFTRRLIRFADVYMSSVVNLQKYSLKHTFYPRSTALPHEGEFHNGRQR